MQTISAIPQGEVITPGFGKFSATYLFRSQRNFQWFLDKAEMP
jgi:hypothetical protein